MKEKSTKKGRKNKTGEAIENHNENQASVNNTLKMIADSLKSDGGQQEFQMKLLSLKKDEQADRISLRKEELFTQNIEGANKRRSDIISQMRDLKNLDTDGMFEDDIRALMDELKAVNEEVKKMMELKKKRMIMELNELEKKEAENGGTKK